MWNEQNKSRIETITKKHNLVRKVIIGETTLEKKVRECEENFYKAAFKWKLKKEEVEKYSKEIKEIGEILSELGYRRRLIPEKEDCYRTFGHKEGAKYVIGGGVAGISSMAGLIAASPFFPPLITVAGVVGMLAVATQMTGMWKEAVGYKIKDKKAWKETVEDTFADLKITARNLDRLVHETYLLDYYQKSAQRSRFVPKIVKYQTRITELFKKTFTEMREEKQRSLIKELLEQKEPNKEVDEWLSQNYPKLITHEGRNKLYT